MKLEDIIETALTYQYRDKYTDELYTIKPDYVFEDDILHILTPVKPYKLVVLRRLLYAAHISVKNIIVGHPDA